MENITKEIERLEKNKTLITNLYIGFFIITELLLSVIMYMGGENPTTKEVMFLSNYHYILSGVVFGIFILSVVMWNNIMNKKIDNLKEELR